MESASSANELSNREPLRVTCSFTPWQLAAFRTKQPHTAGNLPLRAPNRPKRRDQTERKTTANPAATTRREPQRIDSQEATQRRIRSRQCNMQAVTGMWSISQSAAKWRDGRTERNRRRSFNIPMVRAKFTRVPSLVRARHACRPGRPRAGNPHNTIGEQGSITSRILNAGKFYNSPPASKDRKERAALESADWGRAAALRRQVVAMRSEPSRLQFAGDAASRLIRGTFEMVRRGAPKGAINGGMLRADRIRAR